MSETLLVWTVSILQVLIALGLVNVWIVRSGRATKFRGAGAQNMREEFAVYGLPGWFLYVVGFLKLLIATVMVVSLFVSYVRDTVAVPALGVLVILMLGAITMHVKVKDPFIKMLPAFSMVTVALLSLYLLVAVL